MSDGKDKPDGTTFTTHVAGGTVGAIINTGQAGAVNIFLQQAGSNSAHGIRSAVGDFVGREKEIGELTAALRAGGKAAICGLKGMGGVGKTELAIYVANELKADFPDAQLLLDMRGTQAAPRSPEDALAYCIRAVKGVTEQVPESLDERKAMYLSVLHGKRALLVIDNAKDGDQVRPLCPPEGCAMLVTSRQSFALPGMTRISLEELPPPEARKLLQDIARRNLADELADRIAKLCGYLPLALRAAGSLLQVDDLLDPEDYARRLADARLKEIGAEGVEIGVEASLSLSYDRLSDAAKRVFLRSAVFPASFDFAAEEVVCLDENHAGLTDLVRRSLVQHDDETKRCRLHDLVRVFAETRLKEAEGYQARLRHAGYYKDVLSLADGLYLQGSKHIQAGLRLYDVERSNILSGQAWAGRNAEGDEIVAGMCQHYPDVGVHMINLRLHSRAWIQWLEPALKAARRLGDQVREGRMLGNLGNAYAALGETRRAIMFHEQALEIARNTNNRHGEGGALGNLGSAYVALGEMRRAIMFHEQALEIARETGNRRGEGAILDNLGFTYAALGEARRAIMFHEQALEIACETGDQRGEGHALGNLGVAYLSLGKMRRAIEYFEQVLKITREMGDRLGENRSLGNLGNVYADLKETRRAIEYFEQVLKIAREMGDRHGEGITLGNLGNAYAALGDPQKAIEYYEQDLEIARETGNRDGEGTTLGNLGNAYAALGEPQGAIECFEHALKVARETGNRFAEGSALNNRADELRKLGRTVEAIAGAEAALKVFETIESSQANVARQLLTLLRSSLKLQKPEFGLVSAPHPGANVEAEARRAAERLEKYKRDAAEWEALPWFKRLFRKKPTYEM